MVYAMHTNNRLIRNLVYNRQWKCISIAYIHCLKHLLLELEVSRKIKLPKDKSSIVLQHTNIKTIGRYKLTLFSVVTVSYN